MKQSSAECRQQAAQNEFPEQGMFSKRYEQTFFPATLTERSLKVI